MTTRYAYCAAALLAWATCSAAPGGVAYARDAEALSTWVWTAETVLDAGARARMLAFLRQAHVDTIYLQLAQTYEVEGFEPLRALLASARAQRIRVVWVDGAPDWGFPEKQAVALAAIERVRRLNQRLARANSPQVTGMLFDVEPYVLAAWEGQSGQLMAGLEQMAQRSKLAAQSAAIELWLTLPFWLIDTHRAPTRRLIRHSDGVVVMAYRDRTEHVVNISRPWLDAGVAQRRPIVIAVETGCIEPSYVSFCHVGAGKLDQALTRVRAQLRSSSAFSGLAVHDYAGWQELVAKGAARP